MNPLDYKPGGFSCCGRICPRSSRGCRKVYFSVQMVPPVGLEPTRGFPHRILSPACIPFHHGGKIQRLEYKENSSLRQSPGPSCSCETCSARCSRREQSSLLSFCLCQVGRNPFHHNGIWGPRHDGTQSNEHGAVG